MSRIAAISTATPPFIIHQDTAHSLLYEHYKESLTPRSLEVMKQLLAHPSIKTRYLSVNSMEELLSLKNEDPDQRMNRFTKWAIELSREAVVKACSKAAISCNDLTGIIVNTCTGYVCPGLSTFLIEKLNLSSNIKAYDLVGSGCGGAIPNLQLAHDSLCKNPDGVVACVSVEICSATFEMGNDISLVVSNAIFGDGAAAAVVWNKPRGFTLVDTISAFDPGSREDVRYVYKKGRLHNQLSPQLPKIIGEKVPPVILSLLARHHLGVSDVKYWALHPGGDKMLENLQQKLNLTNEQMEPSKEILLNYGNMSSPTVLFALDKIVQNPIEHDAWCVLVAFGAGLSVYAYLLRT